MFTWQFPTLTLQVGNVYLTVPDFNTTGGQCLPDRPREEERILRDDGEARPQGGQVDTVDVDVVDVDLSACQLQHAEERQSQRRLATARPPTQPDL